MLIRYAHNPLRTVIELDEAGRERLRLKIEIEELEERVYGAHFHLEPGEHFDPASALRALDVDGLEDVPRRKRIAELAEMYEADLRDAHAGDCTCFPSSCVKCHAEGLLGVDTIVGLGKHAAHKIAGTFGRGADERTLDEAIARLEDYRPERAGAWLEHPAEDFERHVPRWTEDARRAAVWLRDYQMEHFPATTPESS